MAEKNNAGESTAPESTSEESTSLAGLESYGGIEVLDGDDDNDLVSIATLLGVGALGTDSTDTEDSPSEIEEEDSDSAEETEEDPDDTESADATDAEGSADAAEGDEDSAPDAEAGKSIPKDIRTLRKSHAFRKEVEPVIAAVRNQLPEVVGIATALRANPKDALMAIRGYSESAAAGLEAAILEQKAAEYVAAKHGIDATALESVLKGGEAIVPSKGLAEEIALLTEEGQEELTKLLKKSPVEAEQVKRLQGQVEQVTEVLQRERVGTMQEKIDDQFAKFVKVLKLEGKLEDLQEAMVVKLSKDPKAMAAYNTAATAAAEGRKADGKKLLEDFYEIMAKYTKELKPATTAVAAPVAKPTKAPAVTKPVAAKAKAAAASTETASRQPSAAVTEAERFARLLKFSKGRAKELGVAWGG